MAGRIPEAKPLYWIPVEQRNGLWQADKVEHRRIVKQLRHDVRLPGAPQPDPEDAYDQLLSEAAKHHFGLEARDS